MLDLIQASLSRGRTVLMILALLLISGVSAYLSIPKESNPDITIPFIYVSMVHDGISPEDAERMLVRPMENELKAIEGVKEMTARASEGSASVVLEFVAGTDPKEALADVRDKVTLAKAKLPDGGEEPTIHEVTIASEIPALTVMLSGPLPERALITMARDLRDELESMTQILEVNVGGDREDIVEILIDPLLMESYQLDQGEIGTLLFRNNKLVAAGTLDTGKGSFAIKVPSVFETVQDVMEMPIKAEGDRVITFGDVAQVRRSYKDPITFARVDGHRAISLEVVKRPGENIIETVNKTKALVDKMRQNWPASLEVAYTGDQSKDVKDMLIDLQNNVLSAVLLVVIVIVAVLGLRSAALVGVAIPGSFLTGILVLSVLGFTVNIVVLFSLIMAVGMLVDGAIVVTEYADRCMSEGIPKQQAYLQASKRMAWPITASTATTLAAFAPLIFWPGIMGEFMKFLPITLIVTLSASLLMALIFVPTLGAIFGKPRPVSKEAKEQLLLAEKGELHAIKGFTGFYLRSLELALKHPLLILLGSVLFAALVMLGYSASKLGMEFFPQVEPRGININVRSHGDLSIYEKDAIMLQLEQRLLGYDDIETLYTLTGKSDEVGYFRLNLKDWDQRRNADEIIEAIRANFSDLAGVEIEIRKDEEGPGAGKDLLIELSSRHPELVDDAVPKLRAGLELTGRFTNIIDNGSKPGIEWQLKVNRADAARFGADVTSLGNTVQMVTNGLKLGEYRPDDVDEELDIRVRFPETKRHLGRLDEIRVKTRAGQVPIGNFVERTPAHKVDTIHRVDGKRVITVSADLVPGAQLSQELPKLQEQFPALGLDPRVSIEVKGQNEEEEESQAFLGNAFLVALFVMAIILVTQFNSFYQAFLILSAVLFSTVGVFLGLVVLHMPFGLIMSGIGVIALAGIVVNNNIVLIDTYNLLRKEGVAPADAIMRTGVQRLRPVLMTTITTVLGLMPMVLEVNVDLMARTLQHGAPSTQWWSQLATAVAGGLTFATLLTLILTPCLLMLGANVEKWWNRHSGLTE